jgi:hypothetical protein
MFRQVATLASVVAVAGVLAASSSQAASNLTPLTRINNVTFSRPVGLPGVTLGAGTYIFEAGPQGTNPHIVRVLSQNRQRVFYMGFTVPKIRPQDTAPGVLTFGEAPSGAVAPILVWYPLGSDSGHEFMYR